MSPAPQLQRGEGRLRVRVPGEVRFWMFVLLADYEMNSLLGATGPASCCVGFVPVPAAPVLGNADLHTRCEKLPGGLQGPLPGLRWGLGNTRVLECSSVLVLSSSAASRLTRLLQAVPLGRVSVLTPG